MLQFVAQYATPCYTAGLTAETLYLECVPYMSEIQSLARGLTILDAIIADGRGLGVTELAERLQIDKSSVSRLIKTLARFEYLQQDTGSRRYVMGKRLHRISFQLLNRLPVREKAKKYLYRLVRETGECSHTAIYAEGRALMIDDVEAEASLRVVGGIGRLLPLHCTAVGKSLLAFAELPIPDELIVKTPRTITDQARLAEHLAMIRATGYALDDEENELGVRCLAAPVYDNYGTTIATIGVSGPTVRVTNERIARLGQMVIAAACELSVELGYTGAR
jgi:IclR family transcriptional regulator, KDG regulon repressor